MQGPSFDLWSGNWIPHATTKRWCSQINKWIDIFEKSKGAMLWGPLGAPALAQASPSSATSRPSGSFRASSQNLHPLWCDAALEFHLLYVGKPYFLFRFVHEYNYVVCIICMHKCIMCLCAQSYPTLCNSMDGSPPGSSVHGILQARILEWVAISSSRGSSWLRDQTHILPCISCIGRWILYHWATWEAPWE